MAAVVGDFGLFRDTQPQPIRAVRAAEESAAAVKFRLPSATELMLALMNDLNRSRGTERSVKLPEAPINSVFASGAMLEIDEFGSPATPPQSVNSLELGGGFTPLTPSGTAGDDPGRALTAPDTSGPGGLMNFE